VHSRLKSLRPWLAPLAVLVAIGVLVPPFATAAERYVFMQALQFAALAVAVPALLVIGAPWHRWASGRPVQAGARAARSGAGGAAAAGTRSGAGAPDAGADAEARPAGTHLVDRIAIARSHSPGTLRAWACLVAYIAAVIVWRLPPVVNALARHPVLTAAEAVTLIAAGCGLWLELVESPPMLPRISRPQRAAFAALPMWSIWALAYIMGFSRGVWFTAFAQHAGHHGPGIAAAQQIAAGVLWAVAALCFVPVVFVSLMTWLRDSSDPDAELSEVPPAARPALLRPPRGWRMPSA